MRTSPPAARRLEEHPAGDQGLPQEIVLRALQYIDDHLHCKLRWEEIAAAMGMDPYEFGRGFKLAIGETPRQYVIGRRVSRATELLARAELSIAEIALEVGCFCQSHLTTMFRKRTGTTPGAFRRAAREGERVLHAAATRRPAPALRHGERFAVGDIPV